MSGSIASITTVMPASAPFSVASVLGQTPFPSLVVVLGGASPWYSDVLKTAFGALFGAAVAFCFAVMHRWIQERNANLRAGNLALFKLRAIQRRTGELRLGVRHEIAEKRDIYPDAPTWSLLKPMMVSMDDIERFDFDGLSFLLDGESGREALKYVKHAEDLFSTLKLVLAHHQDTALEFQKATVDLRRSTPDASWKQIEEHVGAELVARRESLFLSLLQQVEKNPEINRACFMKLKRAMKERFHKRVWNLDIDFDPTSARAEKNLPPLPGDLKQVVAAFSN